MPNGLPKTRRTGWRLFGSTARAISRRCRLLIGQIQIETFRLPEAALSALFDEERKSSHRQIASSNLKPDGFFVLGTQGLKNFVVRAEAQGSEVRGVTVLYDQATEGTMSSVALAVANAFVGFPDPNVLPPAGLRRRVEYGSAIVVSSDGALVTAARNVDRCEVITVPDCRRQDERAGACSALRRAQSRAGAVC